VLDLLDAGPLGLQTLINQRFQGMPISTYTISNIIFKPGRE
jgi:hypothetical protein